MLNANDQRLRATQMAQDGIRQLLDTGLSFTRIAEASTTAAVALVLERAGREDAHNLLTSFVLTIV
jgi:hypothetical protein